MGTTSISILLFVTKKYTKKGKNIIKALRIKMILSWIGVFACLAFVVIINFICFFYLSTTLSISGRFNANYILLPIQLPFVFYSDPPQTRSTFALLALLDDQKFSSTSSNLIILDIYIIKLWSISLVVHLCIGDLSYSNVYTTRHILVIKIQP